MIKNILVSVVFKYFHLFKILSRQDRFPIFPKNALSICFPIQTVRKCDTPTIHHLLNCLKYDLELHRNKCKDNLFSDNHIRSYTIYVKGQVTMIQLYKTIHIQAQILTYYKAVCIYVYIYVYVCICMCKCMHTHAYIGYRCDAKFSIKMDTLITIVTG